MSSVPYTFATASNSIPLSELDTNFTTINQATVDDFTGDGTTTSFTLSSAPPGINYTQVFINGVYQFKSTYSVSGTTLTFSQAPPYSAPGTTNIEVIHS